MGLRLVFLAIAASGASSFGVLPAARTTAATAVRATVKSRFNPVSRRQQQRPGILAAARVPGDTAEKRIGEDGGGGGGGSAALAVAVAGGGGGVTTSKKVVAAGVQKATGAIQVGAAFDPAAAAEEAAKTKAQAVTRRAAKSVVRSLPGTWWTAGLPKWMHLVRRRMITKEDWMHLHAASGAVSLPTRFRYPRFF